MKKDIIVLCINPGSTSTKIALFHNKTKLDETNLAHNMDELSKYPDIPSQLPMRSKAIYEYLESRGVKPETIDAIAVRGAPGGRKYHGGAYAIDEEMVKASKDARNARHPMCLSPIIAYEWMTKYNIPAFTYDVVMVDEMLDIAKISSLPQFERGSSCHVLNTRQVAKETASEQGTSYDKVNYIMCHMGGGISTSLHSLGRIIDVIPSGDGTFTPSRAGKIHRDDLMKMVFSLGHTESELKKLFTSHSGLVAYLGTNDCQEVEARISGGDTKARLVYEAMAYNISKDIASLSIPVCGRVDAIVLTGGIAYSRLLTDMITERVRFIAPVIVKGGSREMEALAYGVLNVLSGKEKTHCFKDTF